MKTPYLYHIDPRIELIRDFIDDDTCELFVRNGKSKLERSQVMDKKGGAKVTDSRTSEHCWIKLGEDAAIEKVAHEICELAKMPIENAESFQLVRYGVGQEYKPHFDTFELDSVSGKQAQKRGGQRVVTAILYLNEVQQGGKTNFPNIGIEVKPQKGSLLIFHNCREGTDSRHPKSLHGGMPVLKGEKWITNLWFRERPFV